jgi:hypothetical protein
MSACGTNASAVRVALKHLSFMMETPDNLRMIELRSTFKIEPDPQGGWQLILWAGDAFDYTTPFRALLGDVAEALGQDREIDLQLPPYEIGEDFVKGTLRFGSTTLRIHYEHSLSYFALLSDGQAPLAGCCRPYSEKRSSSLTSGGGGMDLRSISGNGMSPIVQVFGRRDDGLTTDCGGRRPKSAKARSRGKLGTGGVTGYGDLMAAPISMLDVTPTGRGRGICTQARLEAWNRHLGKRLERINERTARRA